MATITRKSDLRPNAYEGTCSDCGKQVTKMAGYLGPKVAGSWTVHHKSCTAATAPRTQARRTNGSTYARDPRRNAIKGTARICHECGNPGYDCDC